MKILGGELISVHGRAAESDGIHFIPASMWLDSADFVRVPHQWISDHSEWTNRVMELPYLLQGLRNAFGIAPHFMDGMAYACLLAVSLDAKRALPILIDGGFDYPEYYQEFMVRKDGTTTEAYRHEIVSAFLRLMERAQLWNTEPWAQEYADGWPPIVFGFDGERCWEFPDRMEFFHQGGWSYWDEEFLLAAQAQAFEQMEATWEFPVENPYELDDEPSWPPENFLPCPSCYGCGMVFGRPISPCQTCSECGLIRIPSLSL